MKTTNAIIKNIREACSATKTLKYNNRDLPSMFVELIYDTDTHKIRTMQHTDAYSRAFISDEEVHVKMYSRPATMKEIREDVRIALDELDKFAW